MQSASEYFLQVATLIIDVFFCASIRVAPLEIGMYLQTWSTRHTERFLVPTGNVSTRTVVWITDVFHSYELA